MNTIKGELAKEAINLMTERVGKIPDGFDGRAVLFFSGGRDSTLCAAAFCHAFPDAQLHLLLIDNGLQSRLGATKRQSNLLKSVFPEFDIIFEKKRVSEIMREVGMQRIEQNFVQEKYSTLLVCCACKLIMNYSAARYASELGIKLLLDGYADRQSEYPEQTPEFMDIIKKMFSDAGLVYLSPLYDFLSDKVKVNRTISELGIRIPKQEPYCMWSDSFSTAKPEEVERYTLETLEIVRNFDPVLRP